METKTFGFRKHELEKLRRVPMLGSGSKK